MGSYRFSYRKSLRAAGGDDLDIAIASPGVAFLTHREIYNAIRTINGCTQKSQILITLKGLAASMARISLHPSR
jgi:ATP-dependent protease ClpP protease subunit